MKNILGIITFVFALVLAPTVFAHGCGAGLSNMMDSLKLDAAQKAKVQPVLDQLKASLKTSGAQMQDISSQLNQLMWATPMDQSAVDAMVDKKVQVISDMIKAKVAAKGQIFPMLTPDQQAKLKGMVKDMEDKMAAKFKNCHDGD